jgi:uracil-DNA glycosylase family 4
MAAQTRRQTSSFNALNSAIVTCDRCVRLREYCRQVAAEKRTAFRDCDYWGRPVPNFGDLAARMLIVGLAPAAHGANRTGRVFTGDRSGDWLFRALHKAGFANQPQSTSRDDGLQLTDCVVTAVVHCAPPGNRPLPSELAHCQPWFQQTIDRMSVRVFVALGQIAWRAVVAEMRRRAWYEGPTPRFAHGARVALTDGRWLLGSYHPSQQNTFTGVLTETMFDAVFRAARQLLD